MPGPTLSTEKRAFVIEHYFRTLSYEKVFELFEMKFPDSPVPNKSTIKRVVDNFQTRWTVEPKPKERRASVLTEKKVKEIRERVGERPSTSVRKLALQMNMHPSSAYRGLKQLKLRAYRATLVQELLPPDPPRRLLFCDWYTKFIRQKGVAALDYFFF